MQLNPNGLVITAVFFGWLSFGVLHQRPWPRRRR
jgi:hypothetical protein